MELAHYLEDLVHDTSVHPAMRELAISTLHEWRNGVVPSSRVLRRLSQARKPTLPCIRMGRDQTCGWLRQHGVGIPLPPVGESAVCPYGSEQRKCAGFRGDE